VRRIAAVLAIAAVLVTAPIAGRADDANETCNDGQGVTLVVDFGSLGGGVNLRCAAQPINNGYDVFRHTNVSYETVSGKDFVCRIATKPADADCSNYPPGDYYWSYWWAKPGEQWQYSSKGAGAHKPSPGSYEGWSFVSGDTSTPPRYPPPPAPATTTTAAASPSPSPSPSATEPPTTGVRGSPSQAPTIPHTATSVGVAATTSTLTVDGALYVIDPSPSTSVALGHVDLSESGKGGGTSLGFILSGLAVVSLGGLAVAFLRTRGR
jgi:hypothetical protein